MRRRILLVAALVTALVAAGCGTDTRRGDGTALRARTGLPASDVTVLTEHRAVDLALAVSRLLFRQAPAVVLADAEDPDGQRTAAMDAVRLGVPLLLVDGRDEGDDAALRAEVVRLAPGTLLASGERATTWADGFDGEVDVVAVGRSGGAPPDRPTPGQREHTRQTAPPRGDAAVLPTVTPPEPLHGLTVLAPPDDHTVAAVATARAAGARVLVSEATDPRTDPLLIEALASQPPSHTVALGGAYGPVERLRYRLAVAATGVELPGGGQVLFPGRLLVALYGHPGDPNLGVLGEQPLDESVTRAVRLADEYTGLFDEPVVPTFEIITTVASADAGPHGDYSLRTPVERLWPWVDAAREAGIYVVLDLQPGHTDFLTQAREYEELLRQPHVGLALDPEWRLAPGQRHMVQIGSVDADEVNEVIEWLADLTAEHLLPQKLLIVHQFTLAMIGNREALDLSRDELAVMIHADGFGTPGQKLDTWRALLATAPPVWWGWKNFYDEDRPMLTPAETVRIEPTPRFVSYQ